SRRCRCSVSRRRPHRPSHRAPSRADCAGEHREHAGAAGSDFYRMAAADGLIAPLVARFRGLKPPRFPSVFEGLINAVACQQLSLEAGLSLLNRLTATYGQAAAKDGASPHAFPRPDDLVSLESQAL